MGLSGNDILVLQQRIVGRNLRGLRRLHSQIWGQSPSSKCEIRDLRILHVHDEWDHDWANRTDALVTTSASVGTSMHYK